MDKLLPCPFCGGEAEIYQVDDDSYGIHHKGDDDCPLECDAIETVGEYVWDTEEEAIAAWNRRAKMEAPDAQT